MNEVIKSAYEMQVEPYKRTLPEVEVGDVYKLEDIWDGEGNVPETSYSYQLTNTDWINYEFDIEEENDNPLETMIRVMSIDLI